LIQNLQNKKKQCTGVKKQKREKKHKKTKQAKKITKTKKKWHTGSIWRVGMLPHHCKADTRLTRVFGHIDIRLLFKDNTMPNTV
jgi:hypothetical protein